AFPPQQRARALALFAAVTGLATVGGPLIGGAVSEGLAWQWIFWLNVPIGAVLVPLVRARVPESRGQARPLDYLGLALASAAAFGAVWGLVRGNEAGWTSPEVTAALLLSAVSAAGFVRWQRRAQAPLIPLRLFGSRAFSAGNAVGFLMTATTFAGAFFFTQFLQVVLHYGALGAGMRIAPWTVTLFLVAPIVGKRLDRTGERPLASIGMLMVAVGFGWIAAIANAELTWLGMVVPFVLAGVGVSMTIPAAQSAVLRAVPVEMAGAASGTYNTVRQLGGAFGIAVPAAVFGAVGGLGSAQEFSDGFRAALATAAVLALAGALIAALIPTRTPAPPAQVPVAVDA
ncbi:MAG: MFS transporter, partial [Mycobacteriaceae bacterium]|nr:MFS transporter [Mycobacteriaceae bacterium]